MNVFKSLGLAGLLALPAAAQLQPGDIAFTGFNADAPDDLAFVALVDIPANTRIYFCDADWNGTAFPTNEGDFSWSHNAVVPAGTVITLNSVDPGLTTNLGSIVHDNGGGISTSSEAFYAYLAVHPDSVRKPSVFLAAISNNGYDANPGVLTGTGLVQDSTAIRLRAGVDFAVYNGPRSGANKAGYLAAIADTTKWLFQDGGANESVDGIVPDLPFNTTAFAFGSSAPVLAAGDIMFTGFNADGNDDLAIVALKDIPANTRIYFCDSEWNGTGFGTDEGDFSWSHTALIPAGTVISFGAVGGAGPTPSIGAIVHDNAGGIGNSDEAFFAYLTTHPDSVRKPSVFLGAIATRAASFGTLTGTGLAVGTTAILLKTDVDIAAYNGTRTDLTAAAFRAALNDSVNWLTQDGDGDQSVDATAPNVPFSLTAFTLGSGSYVPPTPPTVTPALSFGAAYYSRKENSGTLMIPVAASAVPSDTARVGLRIVSGGTAVVGTDYTFANTTFVWPKDSAGPRMLSVPLINNGAAQPDRFFMLEMHTPVGATLGTVNRVSVYILDDDTQAPAASTELDLRLVSSYRVDTTSGASAEIVAHDPVSQRLFVMNSTRDKLEILNFRNPGAITKVSTIDLLAYGTGGTSVAVRDGIVAVAIDTAGFQPGKVVFLDTNGTVKKSVKVGSLPDMVTFSPDGRYVLTANEGQPSNDYTIDPEGSVSIIDMQGGLDSVTQARVSTAGFTAFNGQEATLRAGGGRIFGVNATVAKDLEPEYITVSEDSKTAWVTLQENNIIARLDLQTKAFTNLFPLGFKDHSLPRNALDASDQMDSIFMGTWPVKGVYMPDAIASLKVGDTTYLFTANEGDAREYAALTEDIRVSSSNYKLDTLVFPNHALLKLNTNIGRLSVSPATGDIDNDGFYEEIHVLGARSFSVWNGGTGAQVWDSGDELERITAADATYRAIFNASNDNNSRKNRSDNKGPEPEGITVGKVGNKHYVFIALERIGGVVAFDVTNPRAPRFVQWANNRTTGALGGDLGSEGIIFIPRAQSPKDTAYIVLANEVSATVSVYSVRDTNAVNNVRPDVAGRTAAAFALHRSLDGKLLLFSRPADFSLTDARGRVLRAGRDAAWVDLAGVSRGRYFLQVQGAGSFPVTVSR